MTSKLRYVISFFLGLGTLGTGFLFFSHVLTGIFSWKPLSMLGTSFLLVFFSTLLSLPHFEKLFRSKTNLKYSAYWAVISVAVVLALILIMYGIGVAGIEYTQHMNQIS